MLKNSEYKKCILYLFIMIVISSCMFGCKKKRTTVNVEEPNLNNDNKNEETIGYISEQISQEITITPIIIKEEEDGEGGNEFKNETVVERKLISVLVSEDDYYYQNERIEIKDLVSKIKEIEGEIIVEITNDNATYRAYKKIVDELLQMEIEVIEK